MTQWGPHWEGRSSIHAASTLLPPSPPCLLPPLPCLVLSPAQSSASLRPALQPSAKGTLKACTHLRWLAASSMCRSPYLVPQQNMAQSIHMLGASLPACMPKAQTEPPNPLSPAPPWSGQAGGRQSDIWRTSAARASSRMPTRKQPAGVRLTCDCHPLAARVRAARVDVHRPAARGPRRAGYRAHPLCHQPPSLLH